MEVALTMYHYRRAKVPATIYFFPGVSYRRQHILCNAPVCTTLRAAIKDVQTRYPFTTDAWVLLPDHLHCLWTLPRGGGDFTLRWGLIKRKVSLACAKDYKRRKWLTDSKRKHRESTLCQRRYWEHQIRDQRDFNNHVDYIHYNPVKHGRLG